MNTVLELIHDQLKGLEDFLAKTTATLQCYDSSDEVRDGHVLVCMGISLAYIHVIILENNCQLCH